jgi:hypothetical protein
LFDNECDEYFVPKNETFPQEERLLESEFSINLLAEYTLRGKRRRSWINFINPFRGLLVLGSPGSGKSYFVIRHIITQHIRKCFAMLVYDFKFDDLSLIAYNSFCPIRLHTKYFPVFTRSISMTWSEAPSATRSNPLRCRILQMRLSQPARFCLALTGNG